MDSIFHAVQIAVEIAAFVGLFYKIGRYTGTNDQTMKTLSHDVNKNNDAMSDHIKDDRDQFEKVHNTLSNLKVQIAKK